MSSQLPQHNSKVAADQSLSFDEVADFFSLPLYDAATTLGVCASSLKKICRENGLERWPYRKFLAGKSIEDIKRDAARMSKLQRQSAQAQIVDQSKVQRAQQPGSNPLNCAPPTLIEAMAISDEFKYGFPSEGLSIVKNKWWGSGQSDAFEGTSEDAVETEREHKLPSEDKADSSIVDECKENGIEESTDLQGAALLKAVRKRIAEDGQRAFELGIRRRYGANKLGKRHQTLLHQIFETSLALPKDSVDISS